MGRCVSPCLDLRLGRFGEVVVFRWMQVDDADEGLFQSHWGSAICTQARYQCSSDAWRHLSHRAVTNSPNGVSFDLSAGTGIELTISGFNSPAP